MPNTQIEDEEKKTGCKRNKLSISCACQSLNRLVRVQVGHGFGFRSRECTWFCNLARLRLLERGKNRQSQSEADSNLTGIQEIVQIKTKDNGEPEGAKTKTAGGEETLPLWQSCVRSWNSIAKTSWELCLAEVWLVQVVGLTVYRGLSFSHWASTLRNVSSQLVAQCTLVNLAPHTFHPFTHCTISLSQGLHPSYPFRYDKKSK